MALSHIRFTLVFASALFVVCNALNIDRLARWFRDGDSLDFFALGAFLLAGLCLFIASFTLVAHRWTLKPFAILLTILSAAVTYFISKYGVAIDSSMIRNAVHTDPTEVGQLLTLQMIPFVLFLMVVPVVLIARTNVTFEPSGRYLWGSLQVFVVAMCVALGALYSQYNAILRAGNVSNKYIVYSLVPLNVISGSINAAAKSLQPWFRRDEKDIEIAAHVAAPGNLVVVLAVGESSRRKNFSAYGYQRRDTNPVLRQMEGLHFLDGIATRASTLYALPKILEKNDIKLTTLVSRVGIPTSCLVNYTLYDNCAAVGETKAKHCRHGDKCYDEDVVPLLRENLASYSSGYRFIVLHLGGGSHGPIYGDRHPPEFRKFAPMCEDADVANKCYPRAAVQLVRQLDPLRRSRRGRDHTRARGFAGSLRTHLCIRPWRVVAGRGAVVSWNAAGHETARGAGGDSTDREILRSDFHRAPHRLSARRRVRHRPAVVFDPGGAVRSRRRLHRETVSSGRCGCVRRDAALDAPHQHTGEQ